MLKSQLSSFKKVDSKTNKIVKNANHLKVGKKIHVKLATSEIDSTVDKIYEK